MIERGDVTTPTLQNHKMGVVQIVARTLPVLIAHRARYTLRAYRTLRNMSRRSGSMETDHREVLQSKAVVIAQSTSSRTRENRQIERVNVYGSVERQNFVILSILLASVCGCFSILTLICSLPAILASIRVS